MNVIKFSPIFGNNVGDLVISKVVEEEMAARGIIVHSYDWMFREPNMFPRSQTSKSSLFQKGSFYLQKYTPDVFLLLKLALYYLHKDQKRYASLIEQYDHVLIGGGNLLMDKMGSDYSFRAANIIKLANQNASIIGVGAGPFRRDLSLRYLEKELANCHHVWVRDDVSASSLRRTSESKKRIAPDPAFLIPKHYALLKAKKPKFIGVNLVGGHLSAAHLRILAKNLVRICKNRNLGIKVINTAYPFDATASRLFLRMLPEDILERSKIIDLEDNQASFKEAYSDISFFVGSRMHSIIFASSYTVPVVGIPWDRKVSGVLKMIYGNQYEDFQLNPASDDFDSDVARALINVTDDEKLSDYTGRVEKVQKQVECEFDALRDRIIGQKYLKGFKSAGSQQIDK